MPNWCECDLYITGPKKDREAFLAKIDAGFDKQGFRVFDILDRLVPTPAILSQIVSPVEIVETIEECRVLNKAYNSNGRSAFMGQRVRYITRDFRKKLLVRYGADNWYDWNIRNRGSKWGDCHTRLVREGARSLVLTFDSAWSPPCSGIAAVSELFPTLTFRMRYYEGGNAFQGEFKVKNGEVLEDWSGHYRGHRGG